VILDLAVRTLACYRLTRLVIDDKITEPVRDRIFARYGDPADSKVSFGVTCPHCVSIYLGIALSSVHMIAPNSRLVRAGTEALALSALTGLLYEREGSRGF